MSRLLPESVRVRSSVCFFIAQREQLNLSRTARTREMKIGLFHNRAWMFNPGISYSEFARNRLGVATRYLQMTRGVLALDIFQSAAEISELQ